MDSKIFARQMIIDIQDLERKGQSQFLGSAIVQYLSDHIVTHPDPTDTPEMVKAKHDMYVKKWHDDQDRNHQSNLEMFRSVITLGQNAVKTGFYLNGGAALAMLAYIGQHGGESTSHFAIGLLWFVWGTLCVALCSGLTYLTQCCFANGWEAKIAVKILNIITISLGFLSFPFFLTGMYTVYYIFKGM